MFTPKTNCPVPFDQQPLNEYLLLKSSCLFSWSISPKRSFVLGLFSFFVLLGLVPSIIFCILMPFNNFYKVLLSDLLIDNIILFFLLVRVYLGWSYILKRLLSATVFYEESGWYDGQVWVKTSEYLMQDRLVGLYQVMPFVLRIKYVSILILFNFGLIYFLKFLLDNYNYILYNTLVAG
uniref:Ycf36 n=1 Tax=Vertebrata lanosa TaxID=1261582 RepID=A0A0B5VQQ4_9FLOR|nr:hypothetical protein [Vertebrata lanosa]AJH65947.1 hypothetical protein [Vertebrata lanosa]